MSGWFDVATGSGGKDYSVSTFPTGLSPAGWRPESATGRIPLGTLSYFTPRAMVGMLINRVVYHGGWTVVVAPWRGAWHGEWKVRVDSEAEADKRAKALYELIKTHQWDPANDAPPSPTEL